MNGERNMAVTWEDILEKLSHPCQMTISYNNYNSLLCELCLFLEVHHATHPFMLIKKKITLDKKIQPAKCSSDNPLFSLTVASSNKNPSTALWNQTQVTMRVQALRRCYCCNIFPVKLEQHMQASTCSSYTSLSDIPQGYTDSCAPPK